MTARVPRNWRPGSFECDHVAALSATRRRSRGCLRDRAPMFVNGFPRLAGPGERVRLWCGTIVGAINGQPWLASLHQTSPSRYHVRPMRIAPLALDPRQDVIERSSGRGGRSGNASCAWLVHAPFGVQAWGSPAYSTPSPRLKPSLDRWIDGRRLRTKLSQGL